MGNQNIKIRRVSLTKRNRKISTIGEKINISQTRDNIEESSTLINERMKKIDQILFDISQSFPMSTGFERRQLQYSYEIYAREKEELQPLGDNLSELLKQYDITIKIESLSDQINKKSKLCCTKPLFSKIIAERVQSTAGGATMIKILLITPKIT